MKPYGQRKPTRGCKVHGAWCLLCSPEDVRPKRERAEGKREAREAEGEKGEGP